LHTCDAEHLLQLEVPPFMLGDLMTVVVCLRRFRSLLQLPHVSMSDLALALLAKPKKAREGATPLVLVNIHAALLRLLAEDQQMTKDRGGVEHFDPLELLQDDELARPDTVGDWAFRQAQHRVVRGTCEWWWSVVVVWWWWW
jgi:hypothetical protein